MVKPDDCSLDLEGQRAVEEQARKLLDRAAAWNRFPTPVPDVSEILCSRRVSSLRVGEPVSV